MWEGIKMQTSEPHPSVSDSVGLSGAQEFSLLMNSAKSSGS